MKLIKVKAVAKKEFIHIYRDFRSLLMALFVPVFLVILFGYVLKMDISEVPLTVWDQQNSVESREFIEQFTASGYFKIHNYSANYAQAERLLDKGDCFVAIIVPPDFGKLSSTNKAVPIQILLDGSDPNRTNIIMGFIQNITQKYSSSLLLSQLHSIGMRNTVMPVDNRIRIWFNPELESKYFIIPGLISLVLIIVGTLLTSLIIAREWERGTMETLLSVPISPIEIIFGKIIPYFIIGVFDLFVIIILAKVLFDIEVPSNTYFLLIFSSCLYLYVAMALGLFISIATKSQLVSNQLGIIATFLPSFLLSGFVFPIENLPVVIQYITLIIPARYFVNIIRAIFLKGIDIQFLITDLSCLFVIGFFLTVLCVKKSQESLK